MKHGHIVLAVAALLSIVCSLQAQWLEHTIYYTEPDPSTPMALLWNETGNKVYVANYGTNDVVVIDAALDIVVKRVPVRTDPAALCLNTANNKVYVANCHSENVSVIDAYTDSVVATVAVGQAPVSLCWNDVENKVYVVNQNSSDVSVIDGITNSVIATIPVDSGPENIIAVPSVNRVYASSWYGSTVSVIDAVGDSVLATVPLGGEGSTLCWNETNSWLYAAAYECSLRVVNAATNQIIASIPAGRENLALCWNATSNKVYAGDRWSDTVTIADGVSNQVIARLATRGVGLTWNSVNNKVYAVAVGGVTIIDGGATNRIIREVPAVISTARSCWNPLQNRTYYGGGSRAITVLRDSGWVGCLEAAPLRENRAAGPTVLRLGARFRTDGPALLLTSTGRLAARLGRGPNTLCGLNPGVYVLQYVDRSRKLILVR